MTAMEGMLWVLIFAGVIYIVINLWRWFRHKRIMVRGSYVIADLKSCNPVYHSRYSLLFPRFNYMVSFTHDGSQDEREVLNRSSLRPDMVGCSVPIYCDKDYDKVVVRTNHYYFGYIVRLAISAGVIIFAIINLVRMDSV